MKNLILTLIGIALLSLSAFGQQTETLDTTNKSASIFRSLTSSSYLSTGEILRIYKKTLDSLYSNYENFKITMKISGNNEAGVHTYGINGSGDMGFPTRGLATITFDMNTADSFVLENRGRDINHQIKIHQFALTATKKLTGLNSVGKIENLNIYSFDNNIVFETTDSKKLNVSVLSINGQLVSTNSIDVNGKEQLQISVSSVGYYVVNVSDENGNVLTKKVSLQ